MRKFNFCFHQIYLSFKVNSINTFTAYAIITVGYNDTATRPITTSYYPTCLIVRNLLVKLAYKAKSVSNTISIIATHHNIESHPTIGFIITFSRLAAISDHVTVVITIPSRSFRTLTLITPTASYVTKYNIIISTSITSTRCLTIGNITIMVIIVSTEYNFFIITRYSSIISRTNSRIDSVDYYIT